MITDMHTASDRMHERIRELEAERDQWQESSGQNYVRATEAEMREDALERENERLRAFIDAWRDVLLSNMTEEYLRAALEAKP